MVRWVYAITVLIALAACGGNGYRAPVENRSNAGSSASAYTVQKGDTLYSIAWRYGFDFRSVAQANRIYAPYTIYPGQKIYLTGVAPVAAKPAPVTPSKTSSPQPAPAKPPAPTATPVAPPAAP